MASLACLLIALNGSMEWAQNWSSVTLVKLAWLKSAPNRWAPWSLAPVKLAWPKWPSKSLTSLRSAPLRLVRLKSAPVRMAPARLALVRSGDTEG